MSNDVFELNCPFCDKLYKLPREKVIKHAGKTINCRRCAQPFSIPSIPTDEPVDSATDETEPSPPIEMPPRESAGEQPDPGAADEESFEPIQTEASFAQESDLEPPPVPQFTDAEVVIDDLPPVSFDEESFDSVKPPESEPAESDDEYFQTSAPAFAMPAETEKLIELSPESSEAFSIASLAPAIVSPPRPPKIETEEDPVEEAETRPPPPTPPPAAAAASPAVTVREVPAAMPKQLLDDLSAIRRSQALLAIVAVFICLTLIAMLLTMLHIL